MIGMNPIDNARLRAGIADRYTATADQHIAHITDSDGTTIRWSVPIFLKDDAQATLIANSDYERVARRMAKERGEELPKASLGDMVHHYNETIHYSHPYDPKEQCLANRSVELCYAEKVHVLCDGDECSWLNDPDYVYSVNAQGMDERGKKFVPGPEGPDGSKSHLG